MILNDSDRNALIKYRVQQSKNMIDEVDFLLKSNKLVTAVNRIYYGSFYIITALALLEKFETSKHQQLIGWFNKNYIQTKVFEKELAKFLFEAYENRNKGDYEPFMEFNVEEVLEMSQKMQKFILTIESFISGIIK